MALVKDSLLAPNGDKIARAATVAVYSTGVQSAMCHGCLICRENDIYLLSAAHAIVDLTHGGTFLISQDEEKFLKNIEFDKILIPKEYVQHGSNDVGIAKFKNCSKERIAGQWLELSLSREKLVGKTVVGHGSVFLRGPVLSNENRIMIDTPSVSGCSGCPLFDNDSKLAALVHGGVKHRGGRTLHSSGIDDVTAYVFADRASDITCCLVDADHYAILQLAECIPPELASKPDDNEAYSNEQCEQVKNFKISVGVADNLNEAMDLLRGIIWKEETESIALDSGFLLLSRQASSVSSLP